MTRYNYEFSGTFRLPKNTIRSNVKLGTEEMEENEIPHSGHLRTDYLKGVAETSFAGKIAAQGGTLENVSIIKREKVGDGTNTTTSSGGKSKATKVILGLFFIIFVWQFYLIIDMFKSAYWHSPIKAWAWFKNFIS